MIKKITIEKLAEMTHNEFGSVREDIEKLAEITHNEFRNVHNEFGSVREDMAMLNEKMDDGFTAMRSEMQQGFRAVLAAVETVEYTKLRMRIDALEERMEKIQKK